MNSGSAGRSESESGFGFTKAGANLRVRAPVFVIEFTVVVSLLAGLFLAFFRVMASSAVKRSETKKDMKVINLLLSGTC